MFRPDKDAINALNSNDRVISTISVTVFNASGVSVFPEPVTISVRIAGELTHRVDLTWDSDFSGTETKASTPVIYSDRQGSVAPTGLTATA